MEFFIEKAEIQRKLHTSPDPENVKFFFYIFGGNARKENNRKSDTRCKHYWNRALSHKGTPGIRSRRYQIHRWTHVIVEAEAERHKSGKIRVFVPGKALPASNEWIWHVINVKAFLSHFRKIVSATIFIFPHIFNLSPGAHVCPNFRSLPDATQTILKHFFLFSARLCQWNSFFLSGVQCAKELSLRGVIEQAFHGTCCYTLRECVEPLFDGNRTVANISRVQERSTHL